MEEIMKKVGDMKLSSTSTTSDAQNLIRSVPSNEKGANKPEESKINETAVRPDIPIELDKGSKLLFKVHADLMQIDVNGKPIPVCPDVLAVIIDCGKFEFRYEIYDSTGTKIYSRFLTNEMNYHIETDSLIFKWVETVNEELVIYAIKLKSTASEAKEFKFLIARCILENTSKV